MAATFYPNTTALSTPALQPMEGTQCLLISLPSGEPDGYLETMRNTVLRNFAHAFIYMPSGDLSTGNSFIFLQLADADGDPSAQIRIVNDSGVIKYAFDCYYSGSLQVDVMTPQVLPLDQWVQLEFRYDISSTMWEVKEDAVRVDYGSLSGLCRAPRIIRVGIKSSDEDSNTINLGVDHIGWDILNWVDGEVNTEDGEHLHQAGEPELFALRVVGAEGGQHLHQAEEPTLAAQTSIPSVQGGQHGHQSGEPALSAFCTLVVQGGQHEHQAGNATLTVSGESLIDGVEGGQHPHQAEEPVLVRIVSLVVQEGQHPHQAETIDISGGKTLTVEGGQHPHQSGEPIPFVSHVLSVEGGQHGHQAEEPSSVMLGTLVIEGGGATHGHRAEEPALYQVAVLVMEGGQHGHRAEEPALSTQVQTLTVQGGKHGHQAATIALSALYVLIVEGAEHGHQAETIEWPPIIGVELFSCTARRYRHEACSRNYYFTGAVRGGQW